MLGRANEVVLLPYPFVMDQRFSELLARGATLEALHYASQLLAERRLREAQLAHVELARVAPELRGHCIGVVADVHAELGETDQAVRAYGAAALAGAPVAWVNARVERLRSARPEIYVTAGGREERATSNQQGVVIVRPHYVAFIPTAAKQTLLSIATKMAISGATGAAWAKLPPGVSSERIAAELQRRPPAEIDRQVNDLAHDVMSWKRGSAWIVQTKLPLGTRLVFTDGREKLHVVPAKRALADATFVRLAREWQAEPRS